MDNTHPTLLQVEDLRAWLGAGPSPVRAVDGVSFDIRRGETFALLGESGCGKSMTALSLMHLLPPSGRVVGGRAVFAGREDLLRLSELQMRRVRGNRIAMIFQEPMTSLNPVLTVGEQISEVLRQHKGLGGAAARARSIELLESVNIPDADQRYDEYPHQLSGGMKQRVMIANALAGEPDLLIADEPTTALDVTIQAQVLDLMRRLQRETGMAVLLITHDLGVVAEMADRVGVMYAGQIVELAGRERFFEGARHPYSQKLFASLPETHQRGESLEIIRGAVPPLDREFGGCRFVDRCEFAWEACRNSVPRWTSFSDRRGGGVRCHLEDSALEGRLAGPNRSAPRARKRTGPGGGEGKTLVTVRDLKVHFPIQKGLLKRTVGHVRAVDGVDLELKAGRTVALVGESGSGKTTAGKALLQLLRPTAGSVRYKGEELTRLKGKALRRHRSDLQIIFQDPYASMNPRMTVAGILDEGMSAQGVLADPRVREARIEDLLEQVGLPAAAKERYPHEFSGGQRQRICIARTLAVEPKLIVCDEPTSALDVSVQAQVLNLIKQLQEDLGLSYLFITHNLTVVEYLAHEVAVMYLGRIVEYGTVEEVMAAPRHPYTQALLSAVPRVDKVGQREVIRLEGELPSPINPPKGCHFHPRCPHAMDVCRREYPGPASITSGHRVKCHLYPADRPRTAPEGAESVSTES